MQVDHRAHPGGLPIACLALAGLGLRYALFLPDAFDCGLSLAAATGNFLSFLTVQANLLLALSLLAPWRALRGPSLQGAVVLLLLFVGLVYETLLRGIWNPEGGEFLASLILHDLVPLAALLRWVRRRERGALRWRDPVLWCAFPLAYAAYLAIRGAATGWWLYPFLDAGALGYGRFAARVVLLLGLFLLGGSALVAWDRRRAAEVPGEQAFTLGDFEPEEEPLADPTGA